MRDTFNPAVSNLNVHLDEHAYKLFKQGWPECNPVGLQRDSRHSPPFVAMKDIISNEERRYDLISNCDINQHWSAMIGLFRGSLRAWFCEVAGAQSILHQNENNYPDTGMVVQPGWWRLPMQAFAGQVRKHCHECSIPLRGHGELAQAEPIRYPTLINPGLENSELRYIDQIPHEQVSRTHEDIFKSKRPLRVIQVVTKEEELGQPLETVVRYLQNADK
jgi:hypothetical protein